MFEVPISRDPDWQIHVAAELRRGQHADRELKIREIARRCVASDRSKTRFVWSGRSEPARFDEYGALLVPEMSYCTIQVDLDPRLRGIQPESQMIAEMIVRARVFEYEKTQGLLRPAPPYST